MLLLHGFLDLPTKSIPHYSNSAYSPNTAFFTPHPDSLNSSGESLMTVQNSSSKSCSLIFILWHIICQTVLFLNLRWLMPVVPITYLAHLSTSSTSPVLHPPLFVQDFADIFWWVGESARSTVISNFQVNMVSIFSVITNIEVFHLFSISTQQLHHLVS